LEFVDRNMISPNLTTTADLFRHLTADKAQIYRAIMGVFAAAKRKFRLHLRPDEVLAEVALSDRVNLEEVQTALTQLTEWGNLQAQPDTARVASIEDFYRKRLLYRISGGGEAAEAGIEVFVKTLARRGELQSVALDDIRLRLTALMQLATEAPSDAAKIHEALRDLTHVFQSLSDNAEAFMASLARSIELQRGESSVVMMFKTRLIDYLQRFVGDLVTRSAQIATLLHEVAPHVDQLLELAARREAHDSAPADAAAETEAVAARLAVWLERWRGLREWFIKDLARSPQAELLRASALAAIPRLLQAISTLNERRAGKSDRAADFRHLAVWFADCTSDADAHRLWRAAFALSPARHLALACDECEGNGGISWREGAKVSVLPMLRERGQLPTRGGAPRIKDRSAERTMLASQAARESAQTEAARARLVTEQETRLSQIGALDRHAFNLFLALLSDALAAQTNPDATIERVTADGSLHIRLVPLEQGTEAFIETEAGVLSGRDHLIEIRRV
jgi:uncharacterized protein (TIGR02677 family)